MDASAAERIIRALNPNGEGFVELRVVGSDGKVIRREFMPAREPGAVAARAIELREEGEVLFGVAARMEKRGTKDAIPCLWAAFVDLDDKEAVAALDKSPIKPTIVIDSGRGRHLYFVLKQPALPYRIEGLNRRLAAALGGDANATDAGRCLRVPGTLNHKYSPPAEVSLSSADGPTHDIEQLEAVLAADPQDKADERRQTRPRARSKPMERVLTHADVSQEGPDRCMAHCPAHDDKRASLSISEGDDGRVLLHCFAGCSTEKIVEAWGLEMADLYPAAPQQADGHGGTTLAADLVRLAEDAGVELFHDDLDQPLARVPVDGHHEVWLVASQKMRLWLRLQAYERLGRVLSRQPLTDAMELLSAKAQFEGPLRAVFVRVAPTDSGVLIDLVDDEWAVIEVTEDRWSVKSDSPVAFVRRPSALPLPRPVSSGRIDELRSFLNVPDERSWRLLIAFLVMATRPAGPYPILILQGEQGSAKTTSARVLRLLVDPVKAMLRAGRPDERDLMIAASGQWIIGFDNLSELPARLSDALCQISTGAGFATRQLYTDADEVIFEATRPLILNGIGGLAERPDLLSRAIVITLREINEERVQDEASFWEEFDEAHPRLLGALLDIVVGVLRHLPDVELDRAPRLADFARVGTAVELTLGWPAGSFLEALTESQSGSMIEALDAEPIVGPLAYIAPPDIGIVATMTELLDRLNGHAGDAAKRQGWPKNPAQLGIRLRRIAPALRKAGWKVDFDHEGRGSGKRRTVRVMSAEDQAPEDGDGGDGGTANERAGEPSPSAPDAVVGRSATVSIFRHGNQLCGRRSAVFLGVDMRRQPLLFGVQTSVCLRRVRASVVVQKLLKPAEVARQLGVSRSWLYSAAADGRIPSIRLGGLDGPLRFVEEDVERWLDGARASWTPGCPPSRLLRETASEAVR